MNTTVLSLVPPNPREAVRAAFDLGEPRPMQDILDSDEFQTLLNEFNEAAEGEILTPIDKKIFRVMPPECDLRSAWIDFVDQRERLKNPKYRKAIIEMALTFDPKHAGIPVLSVPKDAPQERNHPHFLDWQKRCLALFLRSIFFYPASIVETTESEMAEDFSSQSKMKDRIEEYDKFKAQLAEGDAKAWAMQKCFERIGVSTYPFSAPPQITALGFITKAMFDGYLNPKEKNQSIEEKQFHNFVRAVNIYRAVWPEQSKKIINGSFIRGLTAIIASFDEKVLKGTDTWVIQILKEAMDPTYKLHYSLNKNGEKEYIGYKEPTDWTSRHGWQGNRFHQDAIVSFADAWNKIRSSAALRQKIKKLKEDPIIALKQSNAKMLSMEIEE